MCRDKTVIEDSGSCNCSFLITTHKLVPLSIMIRGLGLCVEIKLKLKIQETVIAVSHHYTQTCASKY